MVLALIGPEFNVKNLHKPTSVVAYEWRYAQYHGSAVLTVLIENAALPKESNLPRKLRWIVKRNAYILRPSSLEPDIDAVVKANPAIAVEPRRVTCVLWVDDNPAIVWLSVLYPGLYCVARRLRLHLTDSVGHAAVFIGFCKVCPQHFACPFSQNPL